jgi:predicted glycosyltransferase
MSPLLAYTPSTTTILRHSGFLHHHHQHRHQQQHQQQQHQQQQHQHQRQQQVVVKERGGRHGRAMLSTTYIHWA